MLKIVILFFILIFTEYSFSQSIVVETYQDSVILATDQNKKILMIFTSDTCSWCEKLKMNLSDPDVIEALNNYIIYYVDMKDKNNDFLVKKYNVKTIPNCIILDKKENILKNSIGYKNKNQLINWLKY